MSDEQTAVSRLTDILERQLDLVGDSIETASTDISAKTEELHMALTDMIAKLNDPEQYAPILQKVLAIQMMLQFQDIVRQQIDTVRTGLECLSTTQAPAGDDADHWFQEQIARLESAYVMQDQWDIHNEQLGIEPVAVAKGDDLTFF